MASPGYSEKMTIIYFTSRRIIHPLIYILHDIINSNVMTDTEVYPVAFIYQLWSAFSEYVYIGSTAKSPEKRLQEHLKLFDWGRNSTSARRLISEVSPSCVLVEMLEACINISRERLHVREQWWIDATPNTLNQQRAIPKTEFRIEKKDPARYIKYLFSMYKDESPRIPAGSPEYNRAAVKAHYRKKKTEILAIRKEKREASRIHCDVCKKSIQQQAAATHFTSAKHKLNEGKSLPRTGLITPLVQAELDKFVPLVAV